MVQGRSTLGVLGGSLPVIMKGSTPDTEVENLHHHISDSHIDRSGLDHQILRQILSQPPIEEEQTTLSSPLNRTHALFHQENGFGSPRPDLDIMRRQMWNIIRIDQVGLDIGVDVEKSNQNGVQALDRRQKKPPTFTGEKLR